MKRKFSLPLYILPAFLLIVSCGGADDDSSTNSDAPIAEKEDKVLTTHGHERIDPYFWIRLSDEQKEAETPDDQTRKVLDYLNAENAYTDKVLAETEGLQETLYNEMVNRMVQEEESVPVFKNGYYYYSRFEEGEDYGLSCRKETEDGEEEIILNEPELAKGYEYFAVGDMAMSTNNNLLAYTVDSISRREYAVFIKNLETGELLPDRIENMEGSIVWANDNKHLFYIRQDPVTLRAYQVWRHELGTSADTDVLVYEEKDETYSVWISKTKSTQFLKIQCYSTLSSEAWILESYDPTGEFRLFQKREKDLLYDIDHFKDRFVIRTNLGGKNYCIMETGEMVSTSKENWITVMEHNDDVLIEGMDIFHLYWVISVREKGLQKFLVRDMVKDEWHTIQFDEAAYSTYTAENPDYFSETLRFGYVSFTTPWSTYDYGMKSREKTLLKQEEIADPEFNSDDYVSDRIFAEGRDGTMIPISMVYKKGTKMDGSNPMLMTGYGSYGSSSDPYFSSTKISLLDRGFIWAIAHIRGGEEMGRHWYEEGKLLKKKNTFYDFIDCAEHLIDKKYTSSEHLYAWGGSAGGLLMGAIVNMRPDLWNGVIAAVPFVDVVSTMLDETIPLTTSEYDEWGNPNVKKYYDYMLSYSPYDNVEAKDYPNIFITTGYWDSQVQYWEPAKWCAKLRDLKTDDNTLIMRCNMDVGHGGASGRFGALKEVAEEFAFILMLEGVEE